MCFEPFTDFKLTPSVTKFFIHGSERGNLGSIQFAIIRLACITKLLQQILKIKGGGGGGGGGGKLTLKTLQQNILFMEVIKGWGGGGEIHGEDHKSRRRTQPTW